MEDGTEPVYRGLAGLEFPITAYDRPTLAISNLLMRGDIDAATRAILSPQTLTPEEMQTIRTKLSKGRKKNPLLDTILDVATNPLVIIGLGLSIAYPMGGSKAIHALGREAAKHVPKVREWMSGLHSAQTNFRDVDGMWDHLAGLQRITTKFKSDYGGKLADAAVAYTKGSASMSKESDKVKRLIMGTKMSGWDVLKNPGGKPWLVDDMILAPGLDKHIDPAMKGMAAKLRNIYNDIWKMLPKKKMAQLVREQESKGIHAGIPGGFEKHYHPRITTFNRFETQLLSGAKGEKEYRTLLKKLSQDGKISGHLKKRLGYSIPHDHELALLEKAGVIDPGLRQTITTKLKQETDDITGTLYDLVAKSHDIPVGTDTAGLLTKEVLAALGGDHQKLSRILSVQGFETKASKLIADRLLSVRHNPMKLTAEIKDLATTLSQPARYSLDALETASKYIDSMASTYAWHGTGIKEGIKHIVKTGNVNNWQKAYLTEELLPLMRGLKHPKSFARSTKWMNMKHSLFEVVRDTKVGKSLPTGTRNWMLENLSDVRGSITAESLGADITSMFYMSTIGGNPSTAAKNLMQNYITTLPVAGPKNMAKGIKELTPKLGEYMGLRAKGVAHHEAFGKSFKELVKMMGEEPSLAESMLAGDILKEGAVMPKLAKGPLEAAKKMLMVPFSASETLNRLIAFYTGKQAQVAAGGSAKSALLAGRDMLMRTQFPGGPLGIPRGLLGTWGPNRQFMHFPMRYLGFLSSSLRFGADPTKWDLGTIGRTIAGSAGAYTVAKNMLGTDLSPGLMWGAMPLPVFENAPFHPLPFVPPMWSVIGTGVKAAYSGNTKGLSSAAAMMVPGGIAARRAYRTLGKKYADYGNRDQQGRIPTYSDKGTLVGSFTPVQLMMKASGIRSTAQQGEQDVTKWLLSQRNKLRDYRRQYMEALSANDLEGAEKINNQFKDAYPQLGGIQVKKSDFKALDNRRQISRINRVMKQLPASYRPLFEQIALDASLTSVARNIEAPPSGEDFF